MKYISLIVIGCSAGGVTALQKLFSYLPKNFSLPIVIVQHLPSHAKIDPELVFGSVFHGRLEEALDKMEIRPGNAYFAPPNYHLLIEKSFSLALSQDDPVHFARPSVDVLFESAAHNVGNGVCGVLMTGANEDGGAGLKAIHDHGGYTIVQSPDEAEYPTMPNSALKLFKPDRILELKNIAEKLIRFSEVGQL